MRPLFFGSPQRRLYACEHPAAAAGNAAVLLCPPFGHEMARAHRLLRVLAERLSRSGAAVLRFDPYGAGDSMGHDDELDLAGWQSDLLTAHQHLVAWSGRSHVVWMGLRLGANACCLAASAKPTELRRVVLCDPILDGAAYLEEMRSRLVEALDLDLGTSARSQARELARQRPELYRDEALGIALSGKLRSELTDTDWRERLQAPRVPATLLLTSPEQLPSAHPGDLRVVALAETVDWLSDLPADGTLLPGRLAAQLTKEVLDGCQ